jgi:hypothetical protein
VNLPDGLRQPDARSCGAACMVVAHGRARPATFADDVRATHRRLTRARLRGRLQLPWPRAIGTPPWAVARELAAITGVPHRTRVVRWSRVQVPTSGVLYVGNRWLPRHVVLVLEGEPPRCYDPGSGRTAPLDGRPVGGWQRRWLTVSPAAPRSRA